MGLRPFSKKNRKTIPFHECPVGHICDVLGISYKTLARRIGVPWSQIQEMMGTPLRLQPESKHDHIWLLISEYISENLAALHAVRGKLEFKMLSEVRKRKLRKILEEKSRV